MAGEPAFKGTAEEWFTENGMARHDVGRIGPYVLYRRDRLYGRTIEDTRVLTQRGRIVGNLTPSQFGEGWDAFGREALDRRSFPTERAALEWWIEQHGH